MKFSKPARTKQQSITLLEPRRLMSLTGGVNFAPAPNAAPTQITHSFGFEHALSNSANAHPPMPADNSFGGPHTDNGGLEARFAKAIAQGSPISFGEPNAAAERDMMTETHAAPSSAFTTMYTSLKNSTVISIDNATPSTTAASTTLSAVADTSFNASVSDRWASTLTSAGVTATDSINKGLVVTTNAAVNSDAPAAVKTAVALPATMLAVQSNALAGITDAAAPSRITLANVEQEFLTVSTLAREMISQLGRDIAIELSHLESNLNLDSINGRFTAHWDGWRSAAAVTGAAIATIVYIQSEADREKTKPNPTFSSKMIEAV